MLTYELKKAPGVPLYESLYRCIREDILTGKLSPGEKLPSKRALAAHLEVSKVTVEGAYSQLLAEGYLRSEEKVGYFVESTHRRPAAHTPVPVREAPPKWELDLTANAPAKKHFPDPKDKRQRQNKSEGRKEVFLHPVGKGKLSRWSGSRLSLENQASR